MIDGGSGHVFWLYGLSGAGKSTLAAHLGKSLREAGHGVLMLDGDDLRAGLNRGLGYSDADRSENIRRAAEIARLGVRSSLFVVASFITPLESHRQLVRNVIEPARLSLVFVDAPLDVCRTRDVKGLYARAQAGQVPQMTGISSGFERPASTDLVLPTSIDPLAESFEKLRRYARPIVAASSV